MDYEQPGIAYTQLTPAQRAQADAIFLSDQMERYTYDLTADGKVSTWRYYKPSEFCKQLIEAVLTGK